MVAPRLSLFTQLRHTTTPSNSLRCTRAIVPAFTTTLPITLPSHQPSQSSRTFTSSAAQQNWLIPNRKSKFKDPKGKPRMPTGGSTRGTTLIWGDYGLRMRDHDRRVSAAQLKNGEDVIRRRLRGLNFRLFMRISAGTAVFTKGNESRMGTGKGAFDYWAARVPVSRIIFEVKADVHEQVIRDAMRLAANKMPGLYEFVKKGDPPLMGITKLTGDVTAESLKRPRKPLAHPNVPSDNNTANRLSSTTPGMLPTNPSASSAAPSAP